MTYRVINYSSGQMLETVAELGDFEMAKQLADRLAADDQERDSWWAVVELVTVYNTPVKLRSLSTGYTLRCKVESESRNGTETVR